MRLLWQLSALLVDYQYIDCMDKDSVKPPPVVKSLENGFALSSILRFQIDWKQIVCVVHELSEDWTSGDACASICIESLLGTQLHLATELSPFQGQFRIIFFYSQTRPIKHLNQCVTA